MRLTSYFRNEPDLPLGKPFLGLRKIIRCYLVGKPHGKRRINCPICGEAASQLEYKHREFRHTKVRVCAKCGHGYADKNFIIKQFGLWSTNRERADYYLNDVIPMWVKDLRHKRLLEIGACDFYLLLKLGILYPGLSLYAYDKYPKQSPPERIAFISNLDDVSAIDYVLMIHTLEHVYELDTFLVELGRCLSRNAVLIVEVPNNSITKHHEVQKGKHITGYHFHFFNEASLRRVFLRHDFKPLMIRSYGPYRWELNGINLLGVFQYLENQDEKTHVHLA